MFKYQISIKPLIKIVRSQNYTTTIRVMFPKHDMNSAHLESVASYMFEAAVHSVLPKQTIKNLVHLEMTDKNSFLVIENNHPHLYCAHTSSNINTLINKEEEDKPSLRVSQNVYVIGFGKAVLGMGRVIEDTLNDHLVTGILSVPHGIRDTFLTSGKNDMLLKEKSRLMVYEGARDNIPDVVAHKAAKEIHTLIQSLTEQDLLLVLMSGGGSALLPLPIEPIKLEDICHVTCLLSQRGASIDELNIVRCHTEVLKGGGVAHAAYPAKVLALILSDIIGDPLEFIASGPTVPISGTPAKCLSILDQYLSCDEIPASILTHLQKHPVSHEPNSRSFDHVLNVMVGNNQIAVDTLKNQAREMAYIPCALSRSLQGEAKEAGKMFAYFVWYIFCLFMNKSVCDTTMFKTLEQLAKQCKVDDNCLDSLVAIVKEAEHLRSGVCLISGGETTVTVKGSGKGGRNQEMALSTLVSLHDLLYMDERSDEHDVSIHLSSESNFLVENLEIVFLSAGTDGIDGPTEAAGAVVSPDLYRKALDAGLDPVLFLENNDSYGFFSVFGSGSNLIKVGHTGTNVMDLQILLIREKPSQV